MINIKASKREKSTTGYTNKLRLEGFIPAILYGGKNANEKISIAKKDLRNFIKNESFLSTVFEIEINGKIVFSKFETNSFPSKEDIKTLLKIK